MKRSVLIFFIYGVICGSCKDGIKDVIKYDGITCNVVQTYPVVSVITSSILHVWDFDIVRDSLGIKNKAVYFYFNENGDMNYLDEGNHYGMIKVDGSTWERDRSPKKININGVTCNIYQRENEYTRVLTSDTLNEKFLQLVADTLGVDKKIIYFHIPDYTGQGEEYGSIVYGYVATYKPRHEKQYTKTEISKPKKIEGKMRTRVAIIAKDFVERQLKSPKTADFCSDCVVEEVESNVYTALSYVDAQNSLGAIVRTHYKLKLKWNGKEWNDINNWKLLDSKFE